VYAIINTHPRPGKQTEEAADIWILSNPFLPLIHTHHIKSTLLHSSFTSAAFRALAPRGFDSGESFFGCEARRRADARATAGARRSARYPDEAVDVAMALKVL
jgi:hypothetical protein